MAIKKQEFYEGAALHALARGGGITSLKYHAPFFVLNDGVFVRLKYSPRGAVRGALRSPPTNSRSSVLGRRKPALSSD